ncbi:hypothetical protein KSD_04450 [Ktedonobacter sp. SOSP1-85]|uniref:VOC family protein n=1 Tax=Ktedonobacter sp. SOSP1-85 TaxID=2778367 RepID=UPI001914F4B6|nr:hypothetical protein KSD_04450 [Ktedonobacter sp. SOSP1-85]
MSLAEQTFQLPWHGIHHIALITADLDATIHSYKDVLGMHVSAIAPSEAGKGRHCLIFVKPNDDNVWGFHLPLLSHGEFSGGWPDLPMAKGLYFLVVGNISEQP